MWRLPANIHISQRHIAVRKAACDVGTLAVLSHFGGELVIGKCFSRTGRRLSTETW